MIHKLFLAVLLAWLAPIHAGAAQRVPVGGYLFPPFVEGKSGVTFDLLQAMNRVQDKYVFEFVDTSANRRYQHLEEGKFQLMLFESAEWGWDPKLVEASNVFLTGDGDIFVARSAPGRDETYFDSLRNKRIAATLGYHYAFANFQTDPEVLKKDFDITLVADARQVVRLVAQGVADVGVVTKSYLQSYLKANPQNAASLLVSRRMDQAYQHTILVKRGTSPSAREINQILKKLGTSGALQKIWAKNGIVK